MLPFNDTVSIDDHYSKSGYTYESSFTSNQCGYGKAIPIEEMSGLPSSVYNLECKILSATDNTNYAHFLAAKRCFQGGNCSDIGSGYNLFKKCRLVLNYSSKKANLICRIGQVRLVWRQLLRLPEPGRPHPQLRLQQPAFLTIVGLLLVGVQPV